MNQVLSWLADNAVAIGAFAIATVALFRGFASDRRQIENSIVRWSVPAWNASDQLTVENLGPDTAYSVEVEIHTEGVPLVAASKRVRKGGTITVHAPQLASLYREAYEGEHASRVAITGYSMLVRWRSRRGAPDTLQHSGQFTTTIFDPPLMPTDIGIM